MVQNAKRVRIRMVQNWKGSLSAPSCSENRNSKTLE